MSQSTESLAATVDRLETKASRYETATNFEAKLEQYTNELSNVGDALGRLQRNVDRMEFLTAVLVEVLDERNGAPKEVVNARERVESVLDYSEDDYWQMVDEDEAEQYQQKIRQAKSTVQTAINSLDDELDRFESDWKGQLDAARKVQRLLGDDYDITGIASDIESFLDRELRDDSNSIPSLRGEWDGLRKNWERQGLDWDEFQDEYDLSDRTIDRLKRLAENEDVKFDQLDETILKELLSVGPAQDVVKITI